MELLVLNRFIAVPRAFYLLIHRLLNNEGINRNRKEEDYSRHISLAEYGKKRDDSHQSRYRDNEFPVRLGFIKGKVGIVFPSQQVGGVASSCHALSSIANLSNIPRRSSHFGSKFL